MRKDFRKNDENMECCWSDAKVIESLSFMVYH
jgi:hypothetical protein